MTSSCRAAVSWRGRHWCVTRQRGPEHGAVQRGLAGCGRYLSPSTRRPERPRRHAGSAALGAREPSLNQRTSAPSPASKNRQDPSGRSSSRASPRRAPEAAERPVPDTGCGELIPRETGCASVLRHMHRYLPRWCCGWRRDPRRAGQPPRAARGVSKYNPWNRLWSACRHGGVMWLSRRGKRPVMRRSVHPPRMKSLTKPLLLTAVLNAGLPVPATGLVGRSLKRSAAAAVPAARALAWRCSLPRRVTRRCGRASAGLQRGFLLRGCRAA